MRRDRFMAAAVAVGLASAGITPATAQGSTPSAQIGERTGPFVITDVSLGGLLEQGFEIKGILGGALILVQDTTLYSCALVPDHEALTYKSQFECSVLNEVTQDDAR